MANNKKNYNKMSTEKAKAETAVDTVIDETVVTEPIVKKAEAPKREPKKFGVVVNCEKLNVRNNPHPNAAIELTIEKGTKVEIVGSNGDFYNVRKGTITEGFDGWCMKKYISVEK